MKWLEDLLANHAELAMDAEQDRSRADALVAGELAKRFEEARPFLLVAVRGVCRAAREQHIITSTADYKAFADKLTALAFATLETYILEIDLRKRAAQLEAAHP